MKNFLRNNGIFLVVIAVLLAAVIGVGSWALGYDPIAGIVNAVGTPFRALSTAVTNWTQDRYDRAFRYDEQQAEIDALLRRVAELEKAAQEGQDALREVERLKDLLGLARERPELTYEEAAVTRRSSTNWGSDLTLNKGSSVGVEVNDCVIDQYGNLVGTITEVGPNWSLVTTILDPDASIGGRIARTDENAILEGDFSLMKEGRLKLAYLPADSALVPGDQITTSGLGGLYPAGLHVGELISVHTEADGISRYGIIAPGADIANVRYVYIVTDFGGAD